MLGSSRSLGLALSLAGLCLVCLSEPARAQATEPAESRPPTAESQEPERWSGFVGVPGLEDGTMAFYAYWMDSTGMFRYREVEAPSVGALALPSSPDTSAMDQKLPDAAIRIFAQRIEERGDLESAVAEEPGQLGYSLRDGRLRLFASQTVSPAILAAVAAVVLALIVALVTVSRRLRAEQVRTLSSRIARRQMEDAREAERSRLARDIHDGPIQDLYALRVQTRMADSDHVEAEIGSVTRELRTIMEGLRPPALSRYGWEAAVESLAARLTQATVETTIDADAARRIGDAAERVQIGSFRIIQEATNNAVQHGSARHVAIQAQTLPDGVLVTVDDNGSGFASGIPDTDDLVADGHYGMAGMAERADLIGDGLSVEASELGGVRVSFRVACPSG